MSFIGEIKMAVTINNFSVPTDSSDLGATLMPKLAYRFRVDFYGLGGRDPGDTLKVTRNVISAGRPSLTHPEITVDAYNSKIYLAGKHEWQTLDVVFRDDVDSNVIRALGAQMNLQVDHNAQSSAFTGAQYKFGMAISTLDGANNGDETVLDRWELAGCFISNIQYGELNYASGTDMVQVTITVRFDNAAHAIEYGNAAIDALSDGETGTAASAGNDGSKASTTEGRF